MWEMHSLALSACTLKLDCADHVSRFSLNKPSYSYPGYCVMPDWDRHTWALIMWSAFQKDRLGLCHIYCITNDDVTPPSGQALPKLEDLLTLRLWSVLPSAVLSHLFQLINSVWPAGLVRRQSWGIGQRAQLPGEIQRLWVTSILQLKGIYSCPQYDLRTVLVSSYPPDGHRKCSETEPATVWQSEENTKDYEVWFYNTTTLSMRLLKLFCVFAKWIQAGTESAYGTYTFMYTIQFSKLWLNGPSLPDSRGVVLLGGRRGLQLSVDALPAIVQLFL